MGKKKKSSRRDKKVLHKHKPIYPTFLIDFKGYWVGISLYLISFFVYLSTVAPTIIFSDSADHVTCSYLLGIAHPSGYPTYTLLGKIATFLPLGNIALRVNLMSAYFACGVIMVIYFILQKLTNQRLISAGVVLAFAFSATFWKVASYAKIYSLFALFVSILILLALKWKESVENNAPLHEQKKILYLFAFIYGISFTNHNLMITLAPAILFYGWLINKKIYIDKKFLFGGLGLFFLGISTYLYLSIRALHHPIIDWAMPTSFKRLLDCITIKMAHEKMFELGKMDLFKTFFTWYIPLIFKQFTPYVIPLSIIGLWRQYVEHRNIFIFLILIAFVNTTFSLLIYNVFVGVVDFESYHLPTFIVVCISIGYGLSWLINLLKKSIKQMQKIFYSVALSMTILILPGVNLYTHWFQSNMSKYYFASDFARNILLQLSPSAILFTDIDLNILPIWYLQYVEGYRADVANFPVLFLTRPWFVKRLLEEYPEVIPPVNLNMNYEDVFKGIVENNIDKKPIYYTFFKDFDSPLIRLPHKEELIKEGLLYKIRGSEDPKNFRFNYRGIFNPEIYKDVWIQETFFVYSYYHADLGQRFYNTNKAEYAIAHLKKSLLFDSDNASYQATLGAVYNAIGRYDNAIEILDDAILKMPDNADFYYNRGVGFYLKNQKDNAIRDFKKTLSLNPNHIDAQKSLQLLEGK